MRSFFFRISPQTLANNGRRGKIKIYVYTFQYLAQFLDLTLPQNPFLFL